MTRTAEICRKYENSACCSRATTSLFVTACRSGRSRWIAARTVPASAPPAPATRIMSASSWPSSPHARRAWLNVVAAVNCRGSSNGNSAIPTTFRTIGGKVEAPAAPHEGRTFTASPGRRPRTSASCRFNSTSPVDAPPATSRPSTIVHGRRRELARAEERDEERLGAVVRRNLGFGQPQRAPLRPRRAAPRWLRRSRAMRPMRGPVPGSAGVAMMRTLNPPRSSRSCMDKTRPRDSSSMSKSNAAAAATPTIPSPARAGLTNQAPPREGQRLHRRARERTLRRSSTQDAPRLASAPSGTAIAIDRSATDGVIRTKTSAVS